MITSEQVPALVLAQGPWLQSPLVAFAITSKFRYHPLSAYDHFLLAHVREWKIFHIEEIPHEYKYSIIQNFGVRQPTDMANYYPKEPIGDRIKQAREEHLALYNRGSRNGYGPANIRKGKSKRMVHDPDQKTD